MHQLNPLTKVVLVFSIILVAFLSPIRWTAPIVIVLVITPLSFLGNIQREYLGAAARLILPVVGFIFVMQSFFLPGGKTVLFEFWIFRLTLETLIQAFITVARIFTMISAFMLLILTTHPSQLMGDLTRRGLPGQFAYVIVSTLQIIPQMQAKAQTILAAQRSRGLETQGSFVRRVQSLVPLVGPLVFGSLVEVEERAIAIEARGFTSSTPKTSFHDIPDTSLDRTFRWILGILVLIVLLSRIWVR
jgi:energy-coupling factor transport system permease protein